MIPMVLRLDAALRAAGVPIDGVSGSSAAAARIDYRPSATQAQRDAGAALLAGFDWSQSAHDAWEAGLNPERKSLRDAAQQAILDIDNYLAAADTGTAVQQQARDHAAVKRQAQILRAVIRRLIQLD